MEFFKDKASVAEATVTVTTEERTYVKQLPLQRGIFGIFGLVMATSSCPYMDFLKPMARFHLPFSTAEETIVRSVSMYLLHQYFVAKRGEQPDLGLEQLETHYENIQKVNDGILERIKGVVQNDADLNALIILQGFADLLTMAISKDLSKIEPLFFRKPATTVRRLAAVLSPAPPGSARRAPRSSRPPAPPAAAWPRASPARSSRG